MKNNLNRENLKRLVAEHQLDDLVEELFSLLSNYLSVQKDRSIAETYDALILISGKHKSLKHENLLGIIDAKDFSLETNKIGYSLLSIVSSLPDVVFEQYEELNKKVETTREKIKKINAQSDFTYDIFLSFSSKDILEAKTLAEGLRGYGLRVFISDEVLKSNVGTSFFDKIDFALKNSKDFILLVTPNAMDSEWVKTEYETFYNEYFIPNNGARKFIIYKGKDFVQSTVPTLFKRLQFAGSLQEILQSYLESDENMRKAIDEKRQKEVANLEQLAIAEKRRKEQEELEKKEHERIAERQKEQQNLENKAIEEKKTRVRKPTPTPVSAGIAPESTIESTTPSSSSSNNWKYAGIGIGTAIIMWLGYCFMKPKPIENPTKQDQQLTINPTTSAENIAILKTDGTKIPIKVGPAIQDEYAVAPTTNKFALKKLKTFQKTGDPSTVAISKNGKYIAGYFSKNFNTPGKDYTLRIWSNSDFKLLKEIPMEEPYSDQETYSGSVLCFDGSESKLLYNNGKKLCVVSLSGDWNMKVVLENVELFGGAFHPTNNDIVYLCGRKKAYSYSISGYKELAAVPVTDPANSYGRTNTCVTDKSVFFSRVFSNKLTKFSFSDHTGKTIDTHFGKSSFEDLHPFAISNNEQYIAISKGDHVCIYNYANFLSDPNGKWLASYKHNNAIFHIQFIGNQYVISSSSDRTVRALDITSGKEQPKFSNSDLSYAEYLSVSPNARQIAVGTLNGRMLLLGY